MGSATYIMLVLSKAISIVTSYMPTYINQARKVQLLTTFYHRMASLVPIPLLETQFLRKGSGHERLQDGQ